MVMNGTEEGSILCFIQSRAFEKAQDAAFRLIFNSGAAYAHDKTAACLLRMRLDRDRLRPCA